MSPAERRERMQGLCAKIEAAEHEAHQLGYAIAGHTLNNAKNALGWEACGNVETAAMASKGRRLGDAPS